MLFKAASVDSPSATASISADSFDLPLDLHEIVQRTVHFVDTHHLFEFTVRLVSRGTRFVWCVDDWIDLHMTAHGPERLCGP